MLLFAFLLGTLALAGEPELLQKYPKVFQRSGDTLTVMVKGDSKKFQDSIEGVEGRVRTTAEEYYPKAKAVVLRHTFVGSELYDVVSLATGQLIHAGAEAPQWRSGLFAAISKRHLLVGLCDSRDCTKLIDQPGEGPIVFTSASKVAAAGIACVVKRAARTATCSSAEEVH